MTETIGPSKKLKVSTPEPFTTKSYPDDMDLKFDDGTTLYVHPVFLSYTSPVFKAMFEHDCKEKNTKILELPGKKSEDFLEFLMCLHPAYQRPVDNKNVIRIVGIAHEYQVPSIESKCEAVMISWLTESVTNVSDPSWDSAADHFERVLACLDILDISITLGIEEVEDVAMRNVARFSAKLYTKQIFTKPVTNSYYSSLDEELRQKCIAKFERIPDNYKTAIFLQRLVYTDDHIFVK